MTDFTLSSKSVCKPYRTPWGAFHVRHYTPISTNAAIHVGRMVTLDWTANSTNVGNVVQSTADNAFFIVGIAGSSMAAGSSGTANGQIAVYEANPMQEFSAVTKSALLASSNVGLRKKLVWDSTLNIAWVDLTASTATDWRVIITGLIDAAGYSGGRVSFRFLTGFQDQIGSTVYAATSSSPLLAFYS